MTPRTYASPEAFKQALEQRLRSSAKTGAEFARKRQLLVFDRFLARIVAVLGDAATLKGGLVLELRLERARTTKDVDLRMVGSPDDVLAKLQEAGRQNLGDFMAFEVGPDDDHPEIQNDGMQYDGLRFRAECKLAGKLYGQPFGVDVAFGDGGLSRRAPRVPGRGHRHLRRLLRGVRVHVHGGLRRRGGARAEGDRSRSDRIVHRLADRRLERAGRGRVLLRDAGEDGGRRIGERPPELRRALRVEGAPVRARGMEEVPHGGSGGLAHLSLLGDTLGRPARLL